MANGIIYLIRNSVSQKCYVGLTTKPLEKRWREHLRSSKNGDERPLYCAIRKYGEASFEVSILETCAEEELSISERKWIKALESFESGYNLTEGGNGYIGSPPEEMREKISQSLIGHSTSEETKKKISDTLKGRKLPEDTKEKIREALSRPECVLKRKELSTGKIHTQEARSKISNSLRNVWKNEAYKKEMSQKKRGSGNSRALLTEEDVLRIRREWSFGGDLKRPLDKETCKMYADQTGSTPDAIFRMLRGHSWKHLL